MTKSWKGIAGNVASPFLIVADHASNHVPADINLGIAPQILGLHVAVDLGVAPLTGALCNALDCPAILGNVSRLVVDLNREEDAPHIIPKASDGHAIPGNAISHEARAERIARFWKPYHDRLATQIETQKPRLLISLHSFTPQLETAPLEKRPWEVGILYNKDERAARIAIPQLKASGIIVGDQMPYSGKLLNATMNRHAEGNAIPYLGIEMRQDLIADPDGVARWCSILAPVIAGLSAV